MSFSDESLNRVECQFMAGYFARLTLRQKLLITMSIAAITVGVLYYRTTPYVALAPAGLAPQLNTASLAGGKPLMPKGYQPEITVRDPFAVPVEFQPKPPPPVVGLSGGGQQIRQKEIMPVLTGVIMAGNIGSAIIQYGADSRSYRRGEFVGPYQIIAIGGSSATLQGPDGRTILSIGR
jgi:hypothetical protein